MLFNNEHKNIDLNKKNNEKLKFLFLSLINDEYF